MSMLFSSRRSVVHSTKGIVACSQPLAAQSGLQILQQGGNAADAAVATAAAMNVTEPRSTGIGGDIFCLYYDAKLKKTFALNGSGRSAASIGVDDVRRDLNIPEGKIGFIPTEHGHSVTVPGAAAGWVDTIANFGSGKVSVKEALAPAIQLADEGFPVSEISAIIWKGQEERLKRTSPETFGELLKADPKAPDGYRAPGKGEIIRNPHLASVFRALAEHGKKGFYEGPVAQSIVEAVARCGGKISLDDLKKHGEIGSERVDPVSLVYSGQGLKEPIELWEHPPNGQGLVALIALGVFQELEKAGKIPKFKPEDHNSTEYLHALIECLRLGFSDGSWFITDPKEYKVPVSELLSPAYLKERGSGFSMDAAMPHIKHGNPAASASDTIYLAVTDKEGNACSFINSVFFGFGSCIVPKNTGFGLQNRGRHFALGPADHPNLFAGHKRPYHTIIPAMITNPKDGSLNTCYGVMGGFMQPQGHLQVLMNMFVFKFNEQEALDSPRFCLETPPLSGIADLSKDVVYLEEGIPQHVVAGLEKLGHKCVVEKGHARARFGRGQVIRRSEDDGQLVWSAGSDQRGDGQAAPQV